MKTLIEKIYKNEKNNKFFYIIEFVSTVILILSIIKHNVTGNAFYYYSFFVSIIPFIISFLFLIAKYKKKLEYLFLVIIIPLGLGYLIFMIPNQVPDEPSHIAKAYTLSQLEVFNSKDKNNVPILKVPLQLEGNGVSDINDYQDINFMLGIKTNYNKEIRTVANTAASYFPMMYLFPSIGLGIGRVLDLSIYTSIYLAQFFNLLFFVIIGFFAIKIIPFGKLIIFTYLLTPMMLQQAASCSADNFLNCCIIIFVSYILFLKFNKSINKISIKQSICLGSLIIFIACSKIVYLPVCLLVLLLYKKLNESSKHTKIILIMSMILAIALACLFYLYSSSFSIHEAYKIQNNVDLKFQLKNVIANPINYALTLIDTLGVKQEMYISTFVGQNLGWFNIPGSYFSTLLFVILLVIAPFLEKAKYFFKRNEKIIINFIVFIIFNFILGAMYLTWTSVGANVIEGVQGRYFIPIIFLTLLTLVMHNKHIEFKNTNIVYFILIFLINVNSLYTVYLFFR